MLLKNIPSYYKQRRDKLTRGKPDAVFLIPGNLEMYRNSDQSFLFRQDSDLYYLTGFDEPDAFLVISAQKTVLFLREKDPLRELWDGERYGVSGAKQIFGFDETYAIKDLAHQLPDLLKGAKEVYYRMGVQKSYDPTVLDALESCRKSQGRSGMGLLPVRDPAEQVGEMRLFKTAEEIELMRKACKISALAHVEAMKQTRAGMNEYEIEALFLHFFKKSGCRREAYQPIVAGGHNATCLHYHFNNETLKDGDLLLIDAGAEYGYYSGDITRTFPVGKKFSSAQAKIYDLVLESQKQALALAKPGTRYSDINKKACEVLADGLISLGVIKCSRDEAIKNGELKKYYPHGTGHYLGMDVHDTGLYQINGESRVIEPGMVFTIEPGLYFQPNDTGYPDEYRGIGIRIEDDVLITANGCEVLTKDVPKERAEVEKLRS